MIRPIYGRVATVARRMFIIVAVLSIAAHAYSGWRTWRGEKMSGDVIGIAKVLTGPGELQYVSTLAIETREGLTGEKHVFACGEVVDKGVDGLRFTFLGNVYDDSPRVDFAPINASYRK